MNTAIALVPIEMKLPPRRASGESVSLEENSLPPGFVAALDVLNSEPSSESRKTETEPEEDHVDAEIESGMAPQLTPPYFLLAAHHAKPHETPGLHLGHAVAASASGFRTLLLTDAQPETALQPQEHSNMDSINESLESGGVASLTDSSDNGTPPSSEQDISQPLITKRMPDEEPERGLGGLHPLRSDQDEANAATPDALIDAGVPFKQEVSASDPRPQLTSPPAPLGAAIPGSAPAVQVAGRLTVMTSQAHEIMRILQQAGDPGPVVRTLQFGLHPRDLGEVRVTLEIGRDRLGVRIETQGEDAARRLELDRGVLDAMLVQAGITPDRSQIEIRVGRSDMWMQTSLEAQGRPGDQGAEFSTHGGAANHDRRRSDGNSTHDTGKSTSATSAAAFSGLGEPRRGIYL